MKSLEERYRALAAEIEIRTEMTVQAGPFAGMRLIKEASWGDGALLTKLLGIYELEVQLSIDEFVARCPDVFINVGCGEGYYAVGVSRRLPSCVTYAIDANPEALDICHRAAEANGVAARLRLEVSNGRADNLRGLLKNAKLPFIFADCEGCEKQLLLESDIVWFSSTLIIVECHEFEHHDIANKLLDKFGPTHECRLIFQGARNPHAIPLLKDVPESLKWLAVNEQRPMTMCWLIGIPRRRGNV